MPSYRSIKYSNAVETTREDSQFSSVLSGGGGGTTTYADFAALVAATGMSSGDMAFVLATNNLYIYKTNGWFKIATVENLQPGSISGVDENYTLAVDGTSTVITATATDPEGFPLTWSYSITSGVLGDSATISQADNVFTITPSTDEANAGEFSITFSATDGVNSAVNATGSFSLTFVPTWNFSAASIGNKNQDVDLGNDRLRGLDITRDGRYLYCYDDTANTFIRYELSTPYSLTGAVTTTNSIAWLTTSYNHSLRINQYGTKMYVTDGANIKTYTFSTPYDVTSMSLESNKSLYNTGFTSYDIWDVDFSYDGLTMFILQGTDTNVAIRSYTLTSPFAVTTATADGISYDFGANHGGSARNVNSFKFNPLGTRLYIYCRYDKKIRSKELTAPFDISTLTSSLSTGPVIIDDGSFCFSYDGVYLYTCLDNAPAKVTRHLV
jgi:hypothetical protein